MFVDRRDFTVATYSVVRSTGWGANVTASTPIAIGGAPAAFGSAPADESPQAVANPKATAIAVTRQSLYR
jgi:hypothetical protein